MFKLNLKIALRNLWKNKGFSLINIGGLAIGLASCMILLLYVAYEWSYDKQFTNYDKTYVVYNNQKTPTQTFSFVAVSGVMEKEVREKVNGVAAVTRVAYPEETLLSYNNNNIKKEVVSADPDFLKIFDYKVLKGNPKDLLKNPDGVVLTETLAKILFNTEDPIGKVIKYDNKEPLKVEAVIQDLPKNSSISADMITSWALYEKINPWVKNSGWGNNYCMLFIQLKDNKFFNTANNHLKGMIKASNPETNNEAMMFPLKKWHLYSKFENGVSVGGKIDNLRIFLILAFSILLIACINFMNLSTAKSEKRAREVGVRKAIGSTRGNLVGQFMLESVLIALFSTLVAFVLIEVSLPYFNNLLGITLKINYTDVYFWTVFIGLALITGIVSGSYPAFYLSSFEPVKVLKGFKLGGSGSLSVRKFLVVFQFAFSACLIICTVVIYQQLTYIKNKPIGYNSVNLLEIKAEGELDNEGKRKVLKDLLIKSGAITDFTEYSTSLTGSGNNTYGFSWPGKNEKDIVLVNFRFTNLDFTKTTGMSLLQGRDFAKEFKDTASVMVNEAMVKTMGMEKPVGQIVSWGDDKYKIIGVLNDYVMGSPYKKPMPLVVMQNPSAANTIIVRLNPENNATNSVEKIKNIIKEVNPAYPAEIKFVSEKFESKLNDEKLLGTLANWFGGLAIFISCLGLLGLALYMATQRKKEISIRKVLGASTGNILTLLNKEFIVLVIIANAVAFPLAYIIINKWLIGFEYHVSLSVIPFLIAISLSILVAILTVSIQSVKVAKSNPVDALKYE
ncbi:ABC transporter permease [Pedobacter montanisoli]|uniref:ABC transporter permease n=1 Tax=Pedobacter montanisoli TaxID=2923277 RepID=A0ABS9ZX87_9SPHI|nr:ABC transporter permease [Pedobacter montanisoli]MCJ0742912.1 ABC transporter permease [Pedobacter montanisoli]